MIRIKYLSVLILLFSNYLFAETFYPSNLLMLDEKFSHHVILVEKSTHTLFIYQNNGGTPQLLKEYKIATGKFKGNKEAQGDHKTPEGIYHIQTFYSEPELLQKYGNEGKIYGTGAFPLNYPNVIDERLGKTGNGIWIHSTDDDNRINKALDSRGCVVLANQDLKDLSKYIDLKFTPVVIVQDVHFLSEKSWKANRDEIYSSVQAWMKSWQEKEFDKYISAYHENEFHDNSRGNFKSYKSYKQAVFARPDRPLINFQFTSILVNSDYAVVQLQQDYQSHIINDIGHKTLYMKKNSYYDWKIITELWEKLPKKENDVAFVPQQRFFATQGSKE